MKRGNVKALLPIGVFLVLYLGLGILFEYGLQIPMGFYNIPIVVAFLAALLVACLQNRALSLDDKLLLMGKGVGDKNIIIMILIFLTAGIFVGVVGRSSADSVAYFLLSLVPAQFAVAVLFVVSCFVALAMGTSVGTITLITPIALSVAEASGFSIPLCVASVMGGAMFGDNLSFISDTTIAACNGQGCPCGINFGSTSPSPCRRRWSPSCSSWFSPSGSPPGPWSWHRTASFRWSPTFWFSWGNSRGQRLSRPAAGHWVWGCYHAGHRGHRPHRAAGQHGLRRRRDV